MVRNGEITVADVKRILRRYWWIPAFITVTLGAMGLAASSSLNTLRPLVLVNGQLFLGRDQASNY
jgi:hypothetical protein